MESLLKRRYLYVLLFSVTILLASAIISLTAFGAIAGFIWLFISGDSAWPSYVNVLPTTLFLLVFTASSLTLTYRVYVIGKKQEVQASLNVVHVIAAAGATALLLLAMASYQWRVGNIGSKTDCVLCSEFCLGKGFTGSGMPPRESRTSTCSCFDEQGHEILNVSIHNLVPHE